MFTRQKNLAWVQSEPVSRQLGKWPDNRICLCRGRKQAISPLPAISFTRLLPHGRKKRGLIWYGLKMKHPGQ